jgi:cytochrome c oxidase assembly protein subunit 15
MSPASAPTWPRRAAWIACAVTFPIFLIGGTVTTLRVGMAVPDWPTTFGQNMFTYPLSEMLQDQGRFWEHSHRLWGALVGLCVVGMTIAVWVRERRGSVRWLAALALLGVVAQGVLGGMRVLENSPQLAFVHGAVAQALFALLASLLFLESRAWAETRPTSSSRSSALRRLAVLATLVVYVQTVVGAWLRHSGAHSALGFHIVLAVGAGVIVLRLAHSLRTMADQPILARTARWLRLLVWIQVALGLLSAVWIFVVTGPHNPVSIGEAIFATAHVACGALLLGACVAALVYTRRSLVSEEPRVAPAGRLETAR